MPSIAEQRVLRKRYRKHLQSSLQNPIARQSSGSAFADGIEQVNRTKHERELIKVVACFVVGCGNLTNNFVTFEINVLLKFSLFETQADL